jgi:hypothetical protein
LGWVAHHEADVAEIDGGLGIMGVALDTGKHLP